MSEVQFTVSGLKYVQADAGAFIDVGNEVARLVKLQLPISGGISLKTVAKTDAAFVTATTSDSLNPGVANTTRATAAGGAAGNITITGIATTNTLLAVVAVKDADQSVLDLSTQFTITATNTINNTGGTATTGYHVVVVYR
jgi:hypothetical protein